MRETDVRRGWYLGPTALAASLSQAIGPGQLGARRSPGMHHARPLRFADQAKCPEFLCRLSRTNDESPHEVSESEWIKLLDQMNFQRILLLEVPLPDATVAPGLAKQWGI